MTATETLHVGFCGLGRMGAEMVAALVRSGITVTAWNRTPAKALQVAATTGASYADTPSAASQDADVVVTMLSDGPAVLQTLGGPAGILSGLREGAVVIECSTIGVEFTREASDLCTRSGISFLDCPVSGSTQVARRGELGLMVGGDAAVIDRMRPVLDALGSSVVHVGPTGSGAAAKVAVNGLLHTFSTALAETLVAARSAGVPPAALFDVLAGGVLWNRFLGYKQPAFTDPDHAAVAFDLRTATKDLHLAWTAAQRAGLSASVVKRALELHEDAVRSGYGERDMAAMAAWFADSAGAAGGPVRHAVVTHGHGDNSPGQEPERN